MIHKNGKYLIHLILNLFITTLNLSQKDIDLVKLDFEMAENSIKWIQHAKFSSDTTYLKKIFNESIANTNGYKCIIKHLSRFELWDDKKYFEYLLLYSGIENKKISGSGVKINIAKQLWRFAFRQPDSLMKTVELIKNFDLGSKALTLAKKYLPHDATINTSFYFVINGLTPAFSIGKMNGIDILHIPKDKDGKIDFDELIAIVAHEMHHSGFLNYVMEKNPKYLLDDRYSLLGTIIAEGMPTYFINRMPEKLSNVNYNINPLDHEILKDWEKHGRNLSVLYKTAEIDFSKNLENKLAQAEILKNWMEGAQGAAYILGADMFATIDNFLGHESAIEVLKDIKKFLDIYNNAAKIANSKGKDKYIYSDKLLSKLN
jgi:hypothetical protein